MSHLVAIGLSHHTAPVALREMVALPPERVPVLLRQLQEQGLGREALLISTCNRVELYAVPENGETTDDLARWLLHCDILPGGGLLPRGTERHLYRYQEQEALRHLFRVASSLDSMIVGEPQIVAQVKDAYRLANEAGVVGPVLHKVMGGALAVAKRVRSETGIAREAVSIGRAGVELARQVLGELQDSSALLIGAGAHGKLVARNLFSHGLTELVIANRTFANASALAETFGASAIPMEEIPRYLERVDIILTSTGAGRILLHKADLTGLMRKRRYRPIVLIDLSVPRVIDPAVGEIDGVFRFDVDDLMQVAEQGKQRRLDAAADAEAIVSAETERWWQQIVAQVYNPRVGQLPRQAEAIRAAELQRAERALADLTPEQRQAVDAMTRAMVKKILHRPMSRMRGLAQSGDTAALDLLLDALCEEEPPGGEGESDG